VINSQIDEAILSVAVTAWRKVARVIWGAHEILGSNLPEGDAGLDLIAERIEVLVQDGRLLAQGDIKNWRYSEVRKPG
jgi:Protein of unknown function